jgi:hypothetical protein
VLALFVVTFSRQKSVEVTILVLRGVCEKKLAISFTNFFVKKSSIVMSVEPLQDWKKKS